MRGSGTQAVGGNRKGRDIGYALAVGSCEKAHGEDACTIAALDATTAFAVPNPNRNLAALSVFQVWLRCGLPPPRWPLSLIGSLVTYARSPFGRRQK